MKKQLSQLTRIRSGLLVMMLCFSLFTYAENKGGHTMLPEVPEGVLVYQGELVANFVGNEVIYSANIRLSEIPDFARNFSQYMNATYEFFIHKLPEGTTRGNSAATFLRDVETYQISNMTYMPNTTSMVQKTRFEYQAMATGALSFESISSPRGKASMTLALVAYCDLDGKNGYFEVYVWDIVLPPVE